MPPKQTRKPTRSPAVKQAGTKHLVQPTARSLVHKQRLMELEAFKREHGHCNVPSTYSANRPLANWVSYVRRRKQIGKIAKELARCLDELGFTWALRHRAVCRRDWDTMVAALTAFKNQHGHCCVPWQPAKYRVIATWLNEVRRRKRMGLLDRKLIRQLDRLGVMWAPNNERWDDMFAELIAYRAKYGDCNVPFGWPENPRLGSWVQRQRTFRKLSTITQDHFERLDKIGFVWRGQEEAWESKYAALVEYQREHGHCRVPTPSKEYSSLSRWISVMRGHKKRGKLSEERIQRLDELGFVWDGRQEPATTN